MELKEKLNKKIKMKYENNSYCGHMNDLAGCCLALDLCKINRIKLNELERIDLLTPVYGNKMDSLSAQKRKMIASIVIHEGPVRINELTTIARLDQQNKTSAQLSRLVKDGILERQADGRYYLKDDEFHRWLVMRLTNFRDIFISGRSKELIPDRKNPISYFIKNRTEIVNKFYQN